MALFCYRTVKNLASIGKSFCLAYILDALDLAVLLAGSLQVFPEILACVHYSYCGTSAKITGIYIALIVGSYNHAALAILEARAQECIQLRDHL